MSSIDIDTRTILRDVTPADVDTIVDAVRAMLDAKVAHWQLEGAARSTVRGARSDDAIAALAKLTVAGAVLYGDLGDAIVGSRDGLVRSLLVGSTERWTPDGSVGG